MFSPRQLCPYVHCCLFKIIYTRFILHPNKFRFFYPFTSRFKSFYLQWPKSVTAISVCPWQFQFVHGNFNLLTAISVCSRQFQFVRDNFNLVTAISICSRQFQFAHGNFNLLTAISQFYSRHLQFFLRQRSRHFSLCSPPYQLQPPTVALHQSQNAKSKVDI